MGGTRPQMGGGIFQIFPDGGESPHPPVEKLGVAENSEISNYIENITYKQISKQRKFGMNNFY